MSRGWSCWGSNRALSSGEKEGMWAVSGYGGGGVVGGVWRDYRTLESFIFWRRGRHVGGGGGGCVEEKKACGRWVWWAVLWGFRWAL